MKKEALISSLVDAHICEAYEIKGASLEEIAAVEAAIGKVLPAQYREFLLGIGWGAGRFLQGTDIFLSALDGLRDEALGLLQDNHEGIELPEDAFVFSMHEGYEFTYFSILKGDDPPVHQYVEGNGPPVLTWKSFSDFLSDSIAQHSHMKAL